MLAKQWTHPLIAAALCVLLPARAAVAVCGDGTLDAGETCDDGNAEARGWCSADCATLLGPEQHLYGAGADGSIYVLNVATQSLIATIPNAVSGYDLNLQAAPNGRFVASFDIQTHPTPRLVLIDTGTNTIGGFIDLGEFDAREAVLAISPNSRKAYIADRDSSVAIVDLATESIEAVVVLDAECSDGTDSHKIDALTASHDGRFLYGSTDFEGYLYRVDLLEGTVACFPFFDYFADEFECNYGDTESATVVISPDGRSAFSTYNVGAEWLARISTSNGKKRIVQCDPQGEIGHGVGIEMTCDGSRLYTLLATDSPGKIASVDPRTLAYTLIEPIDHIGDESRFTELSRDGWTLFWSRRSSSAGFVWADVLTGNQSMVDFIGTSIDGVGLVTLPTGGATPCNPTPAPGCVSGFAKASLVVDERTPGGEKLLAKFAKGPNINQLDFGNPLRPPCGSTAYAVCIYDDANALVGTLEVDRAGHACEPGVECWKTVSQDPPNGKGYSYKDPPTQSDGVKKLRLRSGDNGSAKILLKAGNSTGQSQLPTGISTALAGSGAATVQLISSDAQCFSVSLTNVKKATSTIFKASQ